MKKAIVRAYSREIRGRVKSASVASQKHRERRVRKPEVWSLAKYGGTREEKLRRERERERERENEEGWGGGEKRGGVESLSEQALFA